MFESIRYFVCDDTYTSRWSKACTRRLNFNHKLQSVCRPKVYNNVNQIIYVNFISLRRYEN